MGTFSSVDHSSTKIQATIDMTGVEVCLRELCRVIAVAANKESNINVMAPEVSVAPQNTIHVVPPEIKVELPPMMPNYTVPVPAVNIGIRDTKIDRYILLALIAADITIRLVTAYGAIK